MTGCRQQKPRFGLTKCPDLVDHYTVSSIQAASIWATTPIKTSYNNSGLYQKQTIYADGTHSLECRTDGINWGACQYSGTVTRKTQRSEPVLNGPYLEHFGYTAGSSPMWINISVILVAYLINFMICNKLFVG